MLWFLETNQNKNKNTKLILHQNTNYHPGLFFIYLDIQKLRKKIINRNYGLTETKGKTLTKEVHVFRHKSLNPERSGVILLKISLLL